MGIADQAFQKLQQYAPKAMEALNKDPKMKQEAEQLANKFDGTKNGLIKALPMMKSLAKNNNFINEAVKALDKKPTMKMAMNGLLMLNGTSVDKLAEELNSATQAQPQAQTPTQPQAQPSSSFKDRLNKYR